MSNLIKRIRFKRLIGLSLLMSVAVFAYDSEQEAAEAGADAALKNQNQTGREAVTLIYRDGTGDYHYTTPVTTSGDCGNASFPDISCGAGCQPVAVLHTHCPDAVPGVFSDNDVGYENSIAVPLYMAQPDGNMYILFHHGDPQDPVQVREGSESGDNPGNEDEGGDDSCSQDDGWDDPCEDGDCANGSGSLL
jgi:hypothetical protein